MDLIEQAASAEEGTPPRLVGWLQTLASLGNVPRKEKQFRNFASNSLNLKRGPQLKQVDEIWQFLSERRDKERAAGEEMRKTAEAEKKKEQEEAAAKKKEEPDSNDEKPKPKSSKKGVSAKKVRKTMKKVLKKASGKSMKFKLLRQQLQTILCMDDKKLLKKMLDTEVGSYKKVKLDGKLVTLL